MSTGAPQERSREAAGVATWLCIPWIFAVLAVAVVYSYALVLFAEFGAAALGGRTTLSTYLLAIGPSTAVAVVGVVAGVVVARCLARALARTRFGRPLPLWCVGAAAALAGGGVAASGVVAAYLLAGRLLA